MIGRMLALVLWHSKLAMVRLQLTDPLMKLFAFLLLATLTAAANSPLVVALKPDKNPDRMVSEKAQLESFLSKKMGSPAKVIIPLSASVILEGLANGSVDAAYLSGADMVNARANKTAEILLAGEINGNPWYQSYWVALKTSPYTSIADLRGKPVAFASRTSTSGYVVPLWDLHQQGFIKSPRAEEFFSSVIFGTGYVSAIERVLQGDAEAAAVSYYVLDEDKHLTPEQRALLKKIDEQGPVPTHVIAVRSSLDADVRTQLKAALTALNQPEHETLRDSLFTSRLVEVDEDAHLAGLEQALKFAKSAQ